MKCQETRKPVKRKRTSTYGVLRRKSSDFPKLDTRQAVTLCSSKYEKRWSHTVVFTMLFFAAASLTQTSKSAYAETVKGIATWYDSKSTKAEGNSGLWTASGERFNESSISCAMWSRNFGRSVSVRNISNGKSIVCTHNDLGPGKKQRQRGVIVDLTPAAFDALGGKRGYTKSGVAYGEIPVEVTL